MRKKEQEVFDLIVTENKISLRSLKNKHKFADKRRNEILKTAEKMVKNKVFSKTNGVYELYSTPKEKRNLLKINKAIKNGKQLNIHATKINNENIMRLITPMEIKVSRKRKKRLVVFQDVLQKGYRSLLIENINKITYV